MRTKKNDTLYFLYGLEIFLLGLYGLHTAGFSLFTWWKTLLLFETEIKRSKGKEIVKIRNALSPLLEVIAKPRKVSVSVHLYDTVYLPVPLLLDYCQDREIWSPIWFFWCWWQYRALHLWWLFLWEAYHPMNNNSSTTPKTSSLPQNVNNAGDNQNQTLCWCDYCGYTASCSHDTVSFKWYVRDERARCTGGESSDVYSMF